MRGSLAALATALALAGCSFNTHSLVSGSRDATSEAEVDAAPDASDASAVDVASDVTPDVTPDSGRTALGIWRITQASSSAGTLNDTGSTRANGIVHFTSDSAAVSYANVTNDRAHLEHGVAICPNPRTIDFIGRGVHGRLNDAANIFTVTEGVLPPTFRLAWVDDRTMTLTYHVVSDLTFTLRRLTFPAARESYADSIEIEIGDEQCRLASSDDADQRVVLLWEHAQGEPAIPAGETAPLARMTSGRSTFARVPVRLEGRPPMAAIGMADGVGAAIAYIVVFLDVDRNGRLDHAYSAAAGGGDRVLGVSNLAIVWRDANVPHTGAENSSFIDTYDGYQTVSIGIDSRSSGGTAPWVVDTLQNPLPTGAFAEDPTHPIIATGLMQTGDVSTPLPDLLR